jgi:hypothetical protein
MLCLTDRTVDGGALSKWCSWIPGHYPVTCKLHQCLPPFPSVLALQSRPAQIANVTLTEVTFVLYQVARWLAKQLTKLVPCNVQHRTGKPIHTTIQLLTVPIIKQLISLRLQIHRLRISHPLAPSSWMVYLTSPDIMRPISPMNRLLWDFWIVRIIHNAV